MKAKTLAMVSEGIELVDNTQVVFLDGPNGKLIASQTEKNEYDKKIMRVGTYNFRGIDTGTNDF
jgi:NAD(P)H-nitrite reductase large subunit